MKDKFNYNDWLEGRISNDQLAKLASNERTNREYGLNLPFIPLKEYYKISDAIHEAFFQLVEISVQFHFERFEPGYRNSDYADLLLEEEINDYEERFKAFKKSIKSNVYKRNSDRRGIDGATFKEIGQIYKEFQESGKTLLRSVGDDKKNNRLFAATVYWNYLERLKELRPDQKEEVSLTDNEVQAIDNVCLDAKRKDKRDFVTEYARLIKTKVKSDLRNLLMDKYNLEKSTFYQWAKEYENELRSISRTKK